VERVEYRHHHQELLRADYALQAFVFSQLLNLESSARIDGKQVGFQGRDIDCRFAIADCRLPIGLERNMNLKSAI
jgi:hypothetical protein